MHIYEYLFTTIVIVTMLIAASTMITMVPQSSITISGKEQLKTVAQKLMTELILKTGDPPNWGSNISISPDMLTSFGLAKYGERIREAYVLDPDKVQRLSPTNPLYIQPSDVVRLLSLGRDYGVSLKFAPAINVSIRQLDYNSYEFSVISDQNGMPLVNANISARTIYYDDLYHIFNGTEHKNSSTDPTGRCTISFGDVPTNARKVLVAIVDYYGIQFTKIYVPSETNATKATMIGNHLILATQQNISTGLCQVFVMKSLGSYVIGFVKTDLTKINGTLYNCSFVEPRAVLFITIPDTGNNLIVAWKEIPTEYSSIPGVTSLPFAYSLERSVVISESSYTMRVQVWRMSW